MAKSASTTKEAKPADSGQFLKDPFDRFGKNTQWIVLALLLGMGFVVFHDFLLFENLFFYKDIASDSLNLSYGILSHNVRYTAEYGFPSWTFEMGMGQNAFSFALYDPLDYLIYPLGMEKAERLMGWKVYLELVASGFIFYHYLRTLGMRYFAAVLGALAYAFSGFMIVSSSWFIFSVEVLTLATLLLAFERLFQKNSFWLFPIPIAYIILSRPFVLATLAIFMLLYMTLRHLQQGSFQPKKYFTLSGKMVLAGICGVLLAMPFLLEHLQIMLESPRGSGANALSDQLRSKPVFALADKLQLGTAFCRSFASDILGSGNQFKGWMNLLEAPAFYCGLPMLLFIPQLFAQTKKRLKWVYATFLLLWFIPVFFPYFRYAFSFFTGDYYRSFSFYVSTVLILLGVWGAQQILQSKKIHLPALGIGFLLLLMFLFYPWFEDDIKVASLQSLVMLLLLVYAALLFLSGKGKSQSLVALLCIMAFELTYFSYYSLHNERDILSVSESKEKKGYNDYSREALDWIRKNDAGLVNHKDFFRIDKRFGSSPAMHASINDAMVQGFFGSSSYHSFNQKGYIQYLKTLKVISDTLEVETRWAPGLASRGILEIANAVKYILIKTPVDPMTGLLCDSLARFGEVTLLRHKHALPLGYALHEWMPRRDFTTCSPVQRDFMSLKAAVIEEENEKLMQGIPQRKLSDTLNPTAFTLDTITAWTAILKAEPFTIESFHQTHFKGSMNLKSEGIAYFSVPYDKGWKVTVDGRETETLMLSHGMTGLKLTAGNHRIEFCFEQLSARKGKWWSLAGVLLFGALVFVSMKNRKSHA